MKVGESMGAKYNDPQHPIVAQLGIGRFLMDLKQETDRAGENYKSFLLIPSSFPDPYLSHFLVAFYSQSEQKASPTSHLNEFSSVPPKSK